MTDSDKHSSLLLDVKSFIISAQELVERSRRINGSKPQSRPQGIRGLDYKTFLTAIDPVSKEFVFFQFKSIPSKSNVCEKEWSGVP